MSDKQISLLLPKEDKNKTRGDGVLAFLPIGPNAYNNTMLLHNYQVINNSGKNYILIIDNGDRNVASAEIYDLDENKVVGVIPKFSLASAAPLVYILPELILHTNPIECYDYEGNIIPRGGFPEEGYNVEAVSIQDSTTIVHLEGGYLSGDFSGQGYRENLYIKISQK